MGLHAELLWSMGLGLGLWGSMGVYGAVGVNAGLWGSMGLSVGLRMGLWGSMGAYGTECGAPLGSLGVFGARWGTVGHRGSHSAPQTPPRVKAAASFGLLSPLL